MFAFDVLWGSLGISIFRNSGSDYLLHHFSVSYDYKFIDQYIFYVMILLYKKHFQYKNWIELGISKQTVTNFALYPLKSMEYINPTSYLAQPHMCRWKSKVSQGLIKVFPHLPGGGRFYFTFYIAYYTII